MEHEFAPDRPKAVPSSTRRPATPRRDDESLPELIMPNVVGLNSLQAEWTIDMLAATTSYTGKLIVEDSAGQKHAPNWNWTVTGQATPAGEPVTEDIQLTVASGAPTNIHVAQLAEPVQCDLVQQIAALAGALRAQEQGSGVQRATGLIVNASGQRLMVDSWPNDYALPGPIPIGAVANGGVVQPRGFQMPDVVSMPSVPARRAIQAMMAISGLSAHDAQLNTPEGEEPGWVSEQSPPAGAEVSEGMSVTLTTTTNPPSTTVILPNLNGQPLALAVAACEMLLHAIPDAVPIELFWSPGGEGILPTRPLSPCYPQTDSEISIEVEEPSR